MLKFLAKIQFSIEMTMWLVSLAAILGQMQVIFFSLSGTMGWQLPRMTSFFLSLGYWRWWWIPLVLTVSIIEWKRGLPKGLQWVVRVILFTSLLLMILSSELPFHSMCCDIK